MNKIITVIFDGQTLHPEQPLDLQPNQRYIITITPISEVTQNNRSSQPGLHLGVISTTDDFDEPLPDEFWLGQE